ncbi:MAG TPA: (Fe-S)-binding protein, partial [Pirellulaceae bacterium]
QRPAISKGCLDQAAERGARTLSTLRKFWDDTRPVAVVVLEPSCASALADDLPDLMSDAAGTTTIPRLLPLDVFLAEAFANGLRARLTSPFRRVLLHGHCHQKALTGTTPLKAVLARVEGLDYAEIDSGCCGMAGSFGYEHFEISRKIAEDRLLPAIRARGEGTEILASGISCRHQISDLLGIRAWHWVQAIRADSLDDRGGMMSPVSSGSTRIS